MADPVFADGVTPLNAANMNKLQTRDEKAAANGYPSLDATGKVPAAQLPPLGTSSATSFSYTYAAAIAEPPAAGQVRLDNASLWDVTKLWISYLTADGHNAYGPLTQIQSGNILSLRAGDNYLFFMVTAYRKVGPDTSGYIEFTGYAWDGTDVFPAPGPVTLDLLWGLPFPNPPIDDYVLTGLAGQTVWSPPPVPPVVNGQWLKGVGGAAVWAPIVRADLPSLPIVPVSSLPTGVPDGFEVLATDNGNTPSFTWHLRYNAGATDGMPWEFLGGSPVHMLGMQGAWTPLSSGYGVYGPTLSAFRAGVYDVQWGAQFQAANSGLIQLTVTASAMSAVAHTLRGGSTVIEAINGMSGRTGVVPVGYAVGMTVATDGSAGASIANSWARFWPVTLT